MDSNYHWQKHQVNMRVQNRLREAEAERRLKEISPRREFFLIRILKGLLGDITSSQKSRRRISSQDAESKKVHRPLLAE